MYKKLLLFMTRKNKYMELLIIILLGALLFYILISTLHHYFLPSPAPSSSNPKSHPLIGSFIPFYANRHRLLEWYTDLLSTSPSQTIAISRLGARRTIVTSHPSNVEHILKTNFSNYPKGKPFTDMLGDLLGSGIFNSDGHLWLKQRKLASHEFTARSLREVVYDAIETVGERKLLMFLRLECGSERGFDMQEVLRRFAFDVICRISLGTELEDPKFAAAFDVAASVSARRGSAPVAAFWKVKRALGVGSEHKLRDAVNQIHKSVIKIIQQRKEEEEEWQCTNKDLLSKLIAGSHSDEATRDMVISFIMAGRDTTSSALTWFFYLISSHPGIESQLLQEINQLPALDYNALKDLRFLEACLYETMRLYPPVVWDSKHAEKADVLPDGTRVKKGDRVTYFPYGMGRMENIWGKDWMDFRPRRWLSEDNDQVLKVSAYKYPVFQGGPRVCLGEKMALVQMKYVAATVLREFEIRRVGTEMPVLVPLLTAHMVGGLTLTLKKRSNSHSK